MKSTRPLLQRVTAKKSQNNKGKRRDYEDNDKARMTKQNKIKRNKKKEIEEQEEEWKQKNRQGRSCNFAAKSQQGRMHMYILEWVSPFSVF